ncbi:T9SS type A sorting domain-containing protein [Cryomorphaceae bacterium 1068]|nr:T9SS type A sorting domain-containing protein [Cryomorphaceae bacterium 1068]
MASGNIVSVIRYGVSSQPSSVLVTDSEGSLQARYELFDDGTGVQIEDVVKSDSDTFYATGEIFDNSVSRNVPFILAFTETEALWFKKYDVGETSAAYSISVNENSDISIAGTRFDPESSGKSVNGLILRTDVDGVVYDAVRIYREGNGFNESTSGIEIRDNGSVVVGLNFLSENGFLPILAEINLDAILNWSSAIESGGGTSFSFRLTLEDNRLLTVGRNLIGQVRLNARASDGQAPCNEVSVDIDLEEITPMVINSPLEFDLVKAFTTELPIEVIPWEIDESEICSEVVSTKEYVEIPVEVFPNPAQDRVQLIIPSGYDKLEIYSIDGKKIDQVNVSIGMNQLDIADFPSGMYILLFSGDSGMVSTKISKL